MKLKKFAVPYTDDKRMLYTKEYLNSHGYRYTEDVGIADFVILPLPTKKHMLKGLDNKIVFAGMVDSEGIYDYYKNENFVLKNAFLTAEGAITLAEEETDFSLFRSKILICGFGRIGKSLLSCLSGYGAEITVCSRSAISKSEALFSGAKHITLDELAMPNSFDLVFNTVPHMIFTEKELKALKNDAVLIDLASFPGGIDTLVSHSLGLSLVDGRGIPKRYCEKTAGFFIGEAIIEILEEGI